MPKGLNSAGMKSKHVQDTHVVIDYEVGPNKATPWVKSVLWQPT